MYKQVPFIMMYLTLGILIVGIILMALGNKLNITYSTKLMCMRIITQAAAVLFVAVVYFYQMQH